MPLPALLMSPPKYEFVLGIRSWNSRHVLGFLENIVSYDYMTSTLITSNTFNTSLGVGSSISGGYVDMSANTAVRLWAYSDQPIQIQIVYADSSVGDSSVSELYSVYRNNTSAINSTKKKAYARTIVTNPLGGVAASQVVVKTRHSTRDPNPVLTYQTDDITLQGTFNMDEFSVSFGNIAIDACVSSILTYGSTVQANKGDNRAILTDTSGRLIMTTVSAYPLNITSSAAETGIKVFGTNTGTDLVALRVDASGRAEVVSSVTNPVYITSSADESSVKIYGNDGTTDRLILTDASGRFLVKVQDNSGTTIRLDAAGRVDVSGTVYTNQSTSSIVAYGNDGTSNRVIRTDASGRIDVTLRDSSGNALTSSGGALNVALGNATINVDISLDDEIVIYGKTSGGEAKAVLVSSTGQVLTTSTAQSISSVNVIYASPTHVASGAQTDVMDATTLGRQINIMGRSSQLCDLQVVSSPDNSDYYNTIYAFLVKVVDNCFNFSVPITNRYVRLVPSADTSLTLNFTY